MMPDHLQPYIERGRIARTQAIHAFVQRLRLRLRLLRNSGRPAILSRALEAADAVQTAASGIARPIGRELAARLAPKDAPSPDRAA